MYCIVLLVVLTILSPFGRLLKTEGSLLEDEALVVTLQSCKTTSADVTEQLETAEETEIKIDAAREVRITGSRDMSYAAADGRMV